MENNAREIRERLGKLVIIGDLIQHVNRISLTPSDRDGIAAPPTITGINLTSFKQDSESTITIQGSNLAGANLSAGGTVGIRFPDVKIDPSGHVLTVKLDVEEFVAPGVYSMIVSTPAGKDEVRIRVTPEKFEVTSKTLSPETLTVTDTVQSVNIEIIGKFLHNVRLKTDIGTLDHIETAVDGKKILAKVTIPAKSQAGKYKVVLSDPMNAEAGTHEILIAATPARDLPPGSALHCQLLRVHLHWLQEAIVAGPTRGPRFRS